MVVPSNAVHRALAMFLLLSFTIAISLAASAHTCNATANQPVDNGNTISATGDVFCNAEEGTDVLTVKLWRVEEFAPDDFWVQNQDGYPPSAGFGHYRSTATGCEAADPPDQFKTETRFNKHGVSADAYSLMTNLDC